MELLTITKYQKTIQLISKFPILPWILILTIPLTGFVLECIGLETAFLRSGAIMIIFALSIVYLNHFVLRVSEDIDNIQKILNSPEFKDKEINKIVLNRKPTNFKPGIQLNEQTHKHLVELRKINSNLVKVEFLSGALGTIVWGFGDVPFKYLSTCIL